MLKFPAQQQQQRYNIIINNAEHQILPSAFKFYSTQLSLIKTSLLLWLWCEILL